MPNPHQPPRRRGVRPPRGVRPSALFFAALAVVSAIVICRGLTHR